MKQFLALILIIIAFTACTDESNPINSSDPIDSPVYVVTSPIINQVKPYLIGKDDYYYPIITKTVDNSKRLTIINAMIGNDPIQLIYDHYLLDYEGSTNIQINYQDVGTFATIHK